MRNDAPRHDEKLAQTLGQERQRGRPQVRPDNETRDIIYEAARHVFAEKGFAAASMETIARAAGVSTRTLYRLIDNKAVLFEQMVRQRIDRFVSAVNLGTCENRNVEIALGDALIICGELVLDPEVIAIQRMILADSDAFPTVAESFYEYAMQRTVAALGDWLKEQQAVGVIRLDDSFEAAGMLLGMLIFEPQRAVWFGHRAAPTRSAIMARARSCAKLFLRGARSAS
jgi:AcrR family transcriptional regulator